MQQFVTILDTDDWVNNRHPKLVNVYIGIVVINFPRKWVKPHYGLQVTMFLAELITEDGLEPIKCPKSLDLIPMVSSSLVL